MLSWIFLDLFGLDEFNGNGNVRNSLTAFCYGASKTPTLQPHSLLKAVNQLTSNQPTSPLRCDSLSFEYVDFTFFCSNLPVFSIIFVDFYYDASSLVSLSFRLNFLE